MHPALEEGAEGLGGDAGESDLEHHLADCPKKDPLGGGVDGSVL